MRVGTTGSRKGDDCRHTRLSGWSGSGEAVLRLGVNRHDRLHQAKSRPRRPSYHVHLTFGGGGSSGGLLDAGGGRLDRLILGQEASSVNQAEDHREKLSR